MNKEEVKSFLADNDRRPSEEERTVIGRRNVHLEVCLVNHTQSSSIFLDDKIDFMASENATATDLTCMSYERLLAKSAALVKRLRNGSPPADKGAELVYLELAKNYVKSLRRHDSVSWDRSSPALLAVWKGIPAVFLERPTPEIAALSESLDAHLESKTDEAYQYFASGKVDEALKAFSVATTLGSMDIVMRDKEMAKNISRLDEILGMAYFGLHGRQVLKGTAVMGARHYGVLDLVKKMMPGNVTIALHPKSADVSEIQRLGLFDKIFTNVKSVIAVPSNLDDALAQANNLSSTICYELRDDLLSSLMGALVLDMKPSAKGNDVDSDALFENRVIHKFVSQLTPKIIEELSQTLRQYRFKGQVWPWSNSQRNKLMAVTNRFLAQRNLAVIPYTREQMKAYARDQ